MLSQSLSEVREIKEKFYAQEQELLQLKQLVQGHVQRGFSNKSSDKSVDDVLESRVQSPTMDSLTGIADLKRTIDEVQSLVMTSAKGNIE